MHICNPSYSGGTDSEDHGSRPAQKKVSETPSQPIAECGDMSLSSQPHGKCKQEAHSPSIKWDPIQKITKAKRDRGVTWVADYLAGKHEVLEFKSQLSPKWMTPVWNGLWRWVGGGSQWDGGGWKEKLNLIEVLYKNRVMNPVKIACKRGEQGWESIVEGVNLVKMLV
jgi:hypothetical protein